MHGPSTVAFEPPLSTCTLRHFHMKSGRGSCQESQCLERILPEMDPSDGEAAAFGVPDTATPDLTPTITEFLEGSQTWGVGGNCFCSTSPSSENSGSEQTQKRPNYTAPCQQLSLPHKTLFCRTEHGFSKLYNKDQQGSGPNFRVKNQPQTQMQAQLLHPGHPQPFPAPRPPESETQRINVNQKIRNQLLTDIM